MHGRRFLGLAVALAVATACSMAAVANAQGIEQPDYLRGASYPTVAPNTYQLTGSMMNAGNGNLEERIADLESALEKMKDAEAKAKKKAEAKPSVTVGGRIMFDCAAFGQDATSQAQSAAGFYPRFHPGAEFRRARMFLKGEAFHVVDYKIQFDFADSDAAFKDVYITVKELPLLQHVRVGHFKEPFGLEQMTSARFITFMERSLSDEGAIVPARNIGLMAFGNWADDNGYWAIGCFKDQCDDDPAQFEDSADTAMACTMRLTFLPWYDEATEGRGLLHAGIAYSYRDAQDDQVQFRARPEAHLGEYVVNTGAITGVDHYHLLGLETALVYGPFSAQAEYYKTWLDRPGAADLEFQGMYVYFSYFLTGEHRPYKRSTGAFDRVKPYENFFRVRDSDGGVHTGLGAWEVAYRYSYLDLADGNITGGMASDHTVGVNWYLNPYTRLMFNYVNSAVTRGGMLGDIDVYEMRAQIDF